MTATEIIETPEPSPAEIIERVLIAGDLSSLNERERIAYYHQVCESLGLNHLTRPFAYIVLDGRLTLYALKACAEQLRELHKVSITRIERSDEDANHVVTAYASKGDGRVDIDIGAVSLMHPPLRRNDRGRMEPNPLAGTPLDGTDAANARMKAITKAKRRVTLSICGLGLLDETQVEDLIAEGRAHDPDGARPARAGGKPSLRVVETAPAHVFTNDVPTAYPATASHSESSPAPASPTDGAGASTPDPLPDSPSGTPHVPTMPATPEAPAPKTVDYKLGWPTGPLAAPEPVRKVTTVHSIQVKLGFSPDPKTETAEMPAHVEQVPGEIVDAALSGLDASEITADTLDMAPVKAALKRLGANVRKAREAVVSGATAEPTQQTGEPVARAADPVLNPDDIIAAQPIIAALASVKHHVGRLKAAKVDLAGRITALPVGAQRMVDQVYAAMLTAAQAAAKR